MTLLFYGPAGAGDPGTSIPSAPSAPAAGDVDLLRADGHRATFYLGVHVPLILWKARVAATTTRGLTAITFDTGSGSHWAAVEAGQEVYIGTTDEGEEIGRFRVRSVSSGDGGTTGTLTVAEHDRTISDNAYITFQHNYPLVPKYPKIDLFGTFYKDRDITYQAGANTTPGPVVVVGDHRAGFAGDQFVLDASRSYAMTPGASISSFAAACYPTTGVAISMDSGTGIGAVRFNTAGPHWVKTTVTDTNGQTQSSYRLFLIYDTDRTAGSEKDQTRFDWESGSIRGDWSSGGWSADVSLHGQGEIANMPRNAIVIIWADTFFGSTAGPVTLLPDDSKNLFVGYLTGTNTTYNLDNGTGRVTMNAATAEEILDSYNFSVSLEALTSGIDTWYEYAWWLTVGRAIHHLFKWHSTALEVMDVIGLADNTDYRAFSDLEDGTLYSMADGLAYQTGIRAHLVCDKSGRMHLTNDHQLLTDAERSSLGVQYAIANDDRSGEITIVEQGRKPVAMAKVSGFYWDGSYNSETLLPDVEPYCAIAPGVIPDGEGRSITTLERQVVRSQAHANELAGRLWAKENNQYPTVSMNFAGNYSGVLEVAFNGVYTITIPSSENPRGFSWSAQKLFCRDVSMVLNVSGGTIACSASFEPEASGFAGVATDCLGFPILGGDLPDLPTEEESLGALLTGASVHFKPASSNLWRLRTNEAVSDLVADPLWLAEASAPSGAIIYRGGVGYFKVSFDGGSTWVDRTPSTIPNDAGDSPAPTAADLDFNHIAGDPLETQGVTVLAQWETGGEYRCWLFYSPDQGSTWDTAEQILGGDRVVDIITNTTDDWITDEATAEINGIVNLDGTYIVSWGSVNTEIHIVVHSIATDGTLSQVITEQRNTPNAEAGCCIRLSDSRILFALSTSSGVYAQTYDWDSVSGILTANAVATIDATAGATSMALVRANANQAYMFWTDNDTNQRIRYADLGITPGGLVSGPAGTKETFLSGTVNKIHAGVMNTTYAIVRWYESTADEIKVQLFNLGTGAWVGTKDTVIAGGASYTIDVGYDAHGAPQPGGLVAGHQGIAVLDQNTALIPVRNSFDNSLDVMVVSRSVTTLSIFGPYATAAANVETAPKIYARPDGDVLITYLYSIVGSTQRFRTTTGSMSGTTFVPDNTEIDTPTISGAVGEGVFTLADVGNGSYAVGLLTFLNAARTISYDYNVTGGGASNVRPLGLAYDRWTFYTVWLTVHYGGQYMAIISMDPTSGTELLNLGLGEASESQVDSKTLWAYPYCWSDGAGGYTYVFGRMDSPYNLSGICHIIQSADDGNTWSIGENGWGTDFCGAFHISYAGYFTALRCKSTGSKLYRAAPGGLLGLVSTLPFRAPVNPHALAVDIFTNTIYAASANPLSTLVVKTLPPYLSWTDITFDHAVTNGVVALEIL